MYREQTITGIAMAVFLNGMAEMRLRHHQIKKRLTGASPCLFFQRSYPETDVDRAKAELCKRARKIGRSLANIEWNVGWASVAVGKIKTHAMTVLAKPEVHQLPIEVLMWVKEDNSQIYLITQHWVASPIAARTEEEGPRIELAMKTNSEDIIHRTYVDITGVPAGNNLFSIIPDRTYHAEEPPLPNGKTIVQLLLGGRVEMDGFTISPIRAVGHAERGRWRFRAYTHHAILFLNQGTDRVEFALSNQLGLTSQQTLRIDDKHVRAEVERAEREGITPPPTDNKTPFCRPRQK